MNTNILFVPETQLVETTNQTVYKLQVFATAER